MPASEFILGGQKSGKSRRAEQRASDWLGAQAAHRAVLIATGQAHDDEMRIRIQRHQQDRAVRVPNLHTVEEPLWVAQAVQQWSQPNTLVVVDCLTLMLVNWAMPLTPADAASSDALQCEQHIHALCDAVRNAQGPVVLVGNEIGLGVIPLGQEVRQFVDALGGLNQQVAAVCQRVTLMVAGLPLYLKGAPL
jgi:adenosylcobinamide kinase / adenosylcobinamide-phosphate guanylyltransferase